VFIKPNEHDLRVTTEILSTFAEASGLHTNMTKIECYPIHCATIDHNFFSRANLMLSQFPCKYLGPPLHFKRHTRVMLQIVVQKIGNRLQGWKRRFFSYPCRDLLVKYVLPSLPTFFLTMFKMPKWAFLQMDKFRRGFLWKGKDVDKVKEGRCLVNCKTCTRPKRWGGGTSRILRNSIEPSNLDGCGIDGKTKRGHGNYHCTFNTGTI
jgi:hypothetical protein